jgi:hypothetical protein
VCDLWESGRLAQKSAPEGRARRLTRRLRFGLIWRVGLGREWSAVGRGPHQAHLVRRQPIGLVDQIVRAPFQPLGLSVRLTVSPPHPGEKVPATFSPHLFPSCHLFPSHGRYVAFQMAEVAIPRGLFAEILRLIAELRPQPPPAPA